MKINELEGMLDSLKGEESVFKLYRNGMYDDILKINDIFLSTGLSSVNKVRQYTSSDFMYRKMALNLEGEKGVGKSALVSTVALSNYMSGKVDKVRYVRYNSSTKRFEDIFNESKADPKSDITVVDDVHYFFPDFYENVLVKGSVSYFDKFVQQLMDLSRPILTGSKSGLVYVSDTHSFRALKSVYDNILFAAGRGDLIILLPNTSTNNMSRDVLIDTEFYGKTYSIAGGDPKLYDIAKIVGEMMRNDTGILANNPRTMKSLIRNLREYKDDLDPRFFEDPGLASKLMKGEVDADSIRSYFHGKADNVIYQFYDELNKDLGSALNFVRNTTGRYSIDTWFKHRAQEEIKPLRDILEKEVMSAVESLHETESKIKEFMSEVNRKQKPFVETYGNIESCWIGQTSTMGEKVSYLEKSQKDLSSRAPKMLKAASNLYDEVIRLRQELRKELDAKYPKSEWGGWDRGANGFLSRQHPEHMYPMPQNAVHGASKLSERIKSKELHRIARSIKNLVSQTHDNQLMPIELSMQYYTDLISKSSNLEKYGQMYSGLTEKVNKLVSERTNIFLPSDTEKIRKLIEDPREAIRNINPHTIGIISNLSVLPL